MLPMTLLRSNSVSAASPEALWRTARRMWPSSTRMCSAEAWKDMVCVWVGEMSMGMDLEIDGQRGDVDGLFMLESRSTSSRLDDDDTPPSEGSTGTERTPTSYPSCLCPVGIGDGRFPRCVPRFRSHQLHPERPLASWRPGCLFPSLRGVPSRLEFMWRPLLHSREEPVETAGRLWK